MELLREFMTFDESNDWNEIIPIEAVNWLEGYVPTLAGVLNTAVLEKTREVIRSSLLEGLTLKERMKALRESSGELVRMTDNRIEAIARTEVTRADSIGRLIAMKANDDVIGVEFSAVMDDRTTEMCIERNGLIMRLDDPRLPENTPPLHVNCVLGDTLVLPIGRVSAISERVFNGDIFVIESAKGNNLAGTPNHPILTGRGWIPLCEIKEGDYIVCNALGERGNVINGKNQQVVACIKNAASAFLDNSNVRATPMPMTAEDFHHDGGQGKVAIIYTDRELLDGVKSSVDKHVVKHGFVWRNVIRSFFENSKSVFFFFRDGFFSPFNSFMSFLRKFYSFFRSCILHSHKLLFMSIARLYAMFNKNAFNCIRRCDVEADSNTANTYTLIMQSDDSFMVNGVDGTFPLNAMFEQNIIHLIECGSVFFAKFTEGESCKIVFDKVVRVKSDRFYGHVYNLQTESGIFVANNIITHNCRSLLLSLTVYDFPDGVLTSHEFDEVHSGIQREEDIAEFTQILEV